MSRVMAARRPVVLAVLLVVPLLACRGAARPASSRAQADWKWAHEFVSAQDQAQPAMQRMTVWHGTRADPRWLQGNLLAGLPVGEWTEWYPDGHQRARGPYVQGAREGAWGTWYPDGGRESEGAYLGGRKEGAWTYWHPNGAVKARGSYLAGLRDGAWRTFYPDGNRESEGAYALGKRTGTWSNITRGGTAVAWEPDAPVPDVLETTAEVEVRGGLSKAQIREVIAAALDEVKRCFEVRLLLQPALAGKLATNFVVVATGGVREAETVAEESSLPSEETRECVLQTLRQLQFPEPLGGGVVVVTYPFVFESTR
ncbi:MAG: AgmX/PglI C-terminal domain-containing protein [Myxococcota bacterium]